MNIPKADYQALLKRAEIAEKKLELIGEVTSIREATLSPQEVQTKIATILERAFRKKDRNVLGCIIARPDPRDPGKVIMYADAIIGKSIDDDKSKRYIERTIATKTRAPRTYTIREFNPFRFALATMLYSKNGEVLGMIVIVAEGKKTVPFDEGDLDLLRAAKRYLELAFAQQKIICQLQDR